MMLKVNGLRDRGYPDTVACPHFFLVLLKGSATNFPAGSLCVHLVNITRSDMSLRRDNVFVLIMNL